MSTVDLVLDVGSSFTTIYKSGEGIVLREPSMVLLKGDTIDERKIIEFGNAAKSLVTKTNGSSKLLYPVQEGAFVYKRATAKMLEYFISKVVARSDYFLKPTVRCFVNVPCGCQIDERKVIEEVLYGMGIKQVYMIEAPIFQAYGSGVSFIDGRSVLAVDIGGGVTDIALLNADGIENGFSYSIGGLNIDRGIIDSIESALSLQIGMLTAESLKVEIGSLYGNENTQTAVYGKSVSSGNPKQCQIATKHIRPMLEYFYGKIADCITDVLSKLDNDVLSSIYERGILVTGGGAKIYGLESFLSDKLKVKITIPQNADIVGVLGGAKLLQDPIQINKILKLM